MTIRLTNCDEHEVTAMTADTERVTIRVPTEKLAKLDLMVDEGKFSTKSDAIRAAIEKFIEDEIVPQNIEKLTVQFPKGNVVELSELVESGESISVDDAIRTAVREYLRMAKDRL